MKTSSSSSAAALTESFDYDLHLETEKPTGFFSRWRLSQFYGVILFVTLTLSFSYYRHTSPHRSVEPPPVDDIISKEKEQETLFKIRLKVTEDLNEQVKSRISLLNESIASLRSRVYEIERKPVMTTSVNFTATKIIIDTNVKSLSDRLHNQSLVLNNLEEMQKITKSDIDKLRAESDEKDTKYSFYAADITERLTRIHTSLDTIQTKREQLLFNLSVTNESKLKSRNMILLGKITKLEEKFSSAIETAGAFTNKMLHTKVEQVDDNGNVKHSSNQVEVVVRNVWSENMEIYQKLIPVPECPKMIIPPPKIIEIIKYAEVVIPVEPPPLSVDYARGHSGAEIVHEETSVTYTPPEIDFKHFSTNILNYLGIDRNSELGDSFIISYLTKIIDIIVPNIIHILGIDNSAGRPEDAISSDMSLGSCWPVQVFLDIFLSYCIDNFHIHLIHTLH